MSTLTKVLIVLLTIFSIFLCGIVVTYVAHAGNQKEIADGLRRDVSVAKEKQRTAEEDQSAAQKAADQKIAELNAKIGELNTAIITKDAAIVDLNRLKDEAGHDRDTAKAAADQAVKLSTDNLAMYKTSEEEVVALKAEKAQRDKELAELNVELMAKMTLLAQRDEEKKQLAEANQDLSNRLNQYLQQYGRMAAAPRTATPGTGNPLPTLPAQATQDIALKGKVVGVDLQNNLAQVSLGSAQGVAPNTRFHVVRGEQYICDIVIKSVDPDKAVGQLNVFDRNRAEPRVGDAVSTNL